MRKKELFIDKPEQSMDFLNREEKRLQRQKSTF
jgi:hypothetical protein